MIGCPTLKLRVNGLFANRSELNPPSLLGDEVALGALPALLVDLLQVGEDVVRRDALVRAAGLRAAKVLGDAGGEVLAQDVGVELAAVGGLELALRALLGPNSIDIFVGPELGSEPRKSCLAFSDV